MLDAADELRRLTRESVGLPEGEEFELELVTGKRWLGLRALPRRAADEDPGQHRPAAAGGRPRHLTSHEIYGGHHTHRVWQETELVRGRGQLERTLDVLWSPEAVISEGIAVDRADVAGGDGQELAAEVLGRLGFDYDAETGSRVNEARRLLVPVAANVAMLIHGRGASPEEAREYSATWSLQPDERVDKLVDSQLRSPLAALPAQLLAGPRARRGPRAGDPGRLRSLMTARMLPGDLASADRARS